MKKTAIVLGATGLTGGLLLQKLIEDERYEKIKLFSRSNIDDLPSKVSQFTGNLLELENFNKDFTADEVFCCIGTTAKKTPDKKVYKAIDYGIPVAAAKLLKKEWNQNFFGCFCIGRKCKQQYFLQQNERGNGARCTCGEH